MNLKLRGNFLNVPCKECGTILKKGTCKRCTENPLKRSDLKSAIEKRESGKDCYWTDAEKEAIAIKTERMIHKMNYT